MDCSPCSLLFISNTSKFIEFKFITSPIVSFISIRSSIENGFLIFIYIPAKKLKTISLSASVKAAEIKLMIVINLFLIL
mgnify:CR=1 FL=1